MLSRDLRDQRQVNGIEECYCMNRLTKCTAMRQNCDEKRSRTLYIHRDAPHRSWCACVVVNECIESMAVWSFYYGGSQGWFLVDAKLIHNRVNLILYHHWKWLWAEMLWPVQIKDVLAKYSICYRCRIIIWNSRNVQGIASVNAPATNFRNIRKNNLL